MKSKYINVFVRFIILITFFLMFQLPRFSLLTLLSLKIDHTEIVLVFFSGVSHARVFVQLTGVSFGGGSRGIGVFDQ